MAHGEILLHHLDTPPYTSIIGAELEFSFAADLKTPGKSAEP